jgi:hypothetical protein
MSVLWHNQHCKEHQHYYSGALCITKYSSTCTVQICQISFSTNTFTCMKSHWQWRFLVVFHKLGEFVENLKARVSTGKWTTAVHCVSLNTVAPALFKYVKYNSQQTHSHACKATESADYLSFFINRVTFWRPWGPLKHFQIAWNFFMWNTLLYVKTFEWVGVRKLGA